MRGCSSCFPGRAAHVSGSRSSFATPSILRRSSLLVAQPERSLAIEGGDTFGLLGLPSQALLSLGLLAGEALAMELISRWLTAPSGGARRPPRVDISRSCCVSAVPRM